MAKSIKNYFAGSNTGKGFYSLYESSLAGLDRIFIIKGGPGTGKSTLMRNIGLELVDRGYDVEFLRCSSDDNSLDGVIIRSLSVGIVDGMSPHIIEPKNPGLIEEIINLGDCWDRNQLLKHKKEILEVSQIIKDEFKKAYQFFAKAQLIHEQIENIYVSNTNFKKNDDVLLNLTNEIFKDYKLPEIRRMFFAANTPIGLVEYIDNLTKDIEKRYILKGSPGTGKSTILKNIAKAAGEKGFDLEIYHCEFDPESVDMVIIPKLSVAIVDGNEPHEINLIRESDVIINLQSHVNEEAITEKSNEILNLQKQYRALMDEGTKHIAKAKQFHLEIEKYYISAMDFEKVNNKKLDILKEILQIIDTKEMK